MQRKLAAQVDIVHDADPVLAAGTADGIGVALIVGTGSVAIGVDGSGNKAICGGWGHWFGDKGSGYDLGRTATHFSHDVVRRDKFLRLGGRDLQDVALAMKVTIQVSQQ